MSRLITAYRALPSPANRAKIFAYMAKHPMAICMVGADDHAFLVANAFIAAGA